MHVGIQLVLQNYLERTNDEAVFDREYHLAELAEPLGFDSIWCVEHHFDSYSMGPDTPQILAYLAGRTKKIKLATGAVILPWNDPLRVVEKMILLDYQSKGRAMFGMGHGLARMEYDGFQIDMNTARERFAESARMIIDGLETGIVKGDGPFYKQKPIEVRPRPRGATWKDRTYMVAMSPTSTPLCAELGAQPMVFVQKPWEETKEHIELFRTCWEKHHSSPPPAPTFAEFMICSDTPGEAKDLAQEHIANYYHSVVTHYEFTKVENFEKKGYGSYAEQAKALGEYGVDNAAKGFVEINAYGTADQIVEKLRARKALIGDFNLSIVPTYGGLPDAAAEKSMRLISEKVLPKIRAF
jgi:alkanesulfonate monooxygenase SsuD/methylene tetrahydromethanopterin reductase-like flavin-dependent oxidoreductase (luciferase family)